MSQVKLKIVQNAECLSVEALRNQSVDMMIISCMFEVTWVLSPFSLAFNPKLQDDLFLLSSVGQEKSFFALSSLPLCL